jgi:Mce-associated membrane protein
VSRRSKTAALSAESEGPDTPGHEELNPKAGQTSEDGPVTDEVTGTDDIPTPDETAARQAGSRRTAIAALGAATVILGSFGIWAIVAANGLRAAAANANVALVDRAETRAVKRDIADTVETIFSYNYIDTARTRKSAQRLLTGAAIRQYDQLFALVEQQAPRQKLVVTTRVTNIGVELLAGDRARVLVFASQQDTRAGTGQASYGGAMFAVTAVRQRGTWKIENIDTFTGGA